MFLGQSGRRQLLDGSLPTKYMPKRTIETPKPKQVYGGFVIEHNYYVGLKELVYFGILRIVTGYVCSLNLVEWI